jgi:two-component system sensor histidine kinase/response regulator
MDGFTATSRIRQDLGLQTLPIVAMTANVMASDREACLAAGMNDHVGKPFDLDHLVRVLRKHAGRQEEAPEGAASAAMAEPALPAEVRAAAAAADVDIGAALRRIDGNLGLYQRMLRMFVKDLAAMPTQLSAYVAQGEGESALRLLHSLKGLAATMSATALAAAAARSEEQLAAGPAPDAAAAIAGEAAAAIAAAGPGLAALLQALQAADAPNAAPPTPAALLDAGTALTALRAMTGQLQNADMAATKAMAELQRQFGGPLRRQLLPINDAIGALDFEHALRLCDGLINELTDGQPA